MINREKPMPIPDYNFFGEDARLHHIGFAVRSIRESFGELQTIEDEIQKVRIALLRAHGTMVEIVEPAGDSSPVLNLLAKGHNLYHVCYQVESIPLALAAARKNGFHSIAKPVPAIAFDMNHIAWVYNSVLGLFELLETDSSLPQREEKP